MKINENKNKYDLNAEINIVVYNSNEPVVTNYL